jgi:hypothetical protein
VKLLDDSTYSGDRQFQLVLSGLTGTTKHVYLASSQATVTVQDNEAAPVQTDPPGNDPPATTPPTTTPPTTTPPSNDGTPPSVTIPGKKGGGGALDIGWTALLGLAWMRRQFAAYRARHGKRCTSNSRRHARRCSNGRAYFTRRS